MSVLLHHLDDLQCCARRIFNKGKLGKANVCRFHDELHALGPQLGNCCLKVIKGEANMITHLFDNVAKSAICMKRPA